MFIRKEFLHNAPTKVLYRMFNCSRYYWSLDDDSRGLLNDELLSRNDVYSENMFY